MEEKSNNDAIQFARMYASMAELSAAAYTDKRCAELKDELAALRLEVKELKENN